MPHGRRTAIQLAKEMERVSGSRFVVKRWYWSGEEIRRDGEDFGYTLGTARGELLAPSTQGAICRFFGIPPADLGLDDQDQ